MINCNYYSDIGQRDKKHLPHKVALYYPKLAKNFLELVERVGNSADTCQQVEDQQLKQVDILLLFSYADAETIIVLNMIKRTVLDAYHFIT